MKRLTFSWDEEKNEGNKKKHGVSFEEAQTVFYDENAVEFFDESHAEQEERFLMLGLSANFRMLLVSYCYREKESVIRIISARKATRTEQKEYGR
ncbi:MAG: BrnT family toxin [Deltaproteobacteria bacterium]|nr:BrnT family toxin [Deltaproteobacteria bacterium]